MQSPASFSWISSTHISPATTWAPSPEPNQNPAGSWAPSPATPGWSFAASSPLALWEQEVRLPSQWSRFRASLEILPELSVIRNRLPTKHRSAASLSWLSPASFQAQVAASPDPPPPSASPIVLNCPLQACTINSSECTRSSPYKSLLDCSVQGHVTYHWSALNRPPAWVNLITPSE